MEVLRSILGYSLFVVAVAYGLGQAPKEAWDIKIEWLAPVVFMVFISVILQTAQVIVFLRANKVNHEWLIPALFTLRKSVLNIILPFRSGTLALLPMLMQHYGLKWHDYIRYSITASVISLLISCVALLTLYSIFSLVFIVVIGGPIMIYVSRQNYWYVNVIKELLVIAGGLYVTYLVAFWCLLNGMGVDVGVIKAAYYGVAVNTLAQVSITPGNLGVREALLGALSPYLSFSVSLGIIIGAVFFTVRLLVSGLLLAILEMMARSKKLI